MVSKTLTAVTVQTPAQRMPDFRFLADEMNNYLVNFAYESGMCLDVEEDQNDDGETFYRMVPSEADCILAARQTVTVAAVLADLCRQIGIEPPSMVTAALTDEPPY